MVLRMLETPKSPQNTEQSTKIELRFKILSTNHLLIPKVISFLIAHL